MDQSHPRVLAPLDIGVWSSSITAIGSILSIAAVNKLLLGVVAKHACHPLESGLHQSHVGEGNT